jgi:hypothetical protein
MYRNVLNGCGRLACSSAPCKSQSHFSCVEFVKEDSYILVDLKLQLCTIYEPGKFSDWEALWFLLTGCYSDDKGCITRSRYYRLNIMSQQMHIYRIKH